MTATPAQRSVAFRNGAVHLLDWGGEGVALHFAHANGFNAQTYVPILSPLAHEAHLLASDLRGHGSTSLPADPAANKSWLTYRDDLIRLLDRLGAGPYILAGHSMGATSSLLAAAKRPDLVRALVLFEPVAPYRVKSADLKDSALLAGALKRRAVFPDAATVKASYTGRGAFRTWPEEMLDAYLRGGLKDDPEGVRLTCDPQWEAANFRLGPPKLDAAIGRLACPVTLLHGTEVSTTSPVILETLRQAQPGARIQRIEGATHFLPMERPDLVRAALREAISAAR